MMRLLLAAGALLGLGACNLSLSYSSAVDMIPMSERSASSPLTPGVYCFYRRPDEVGDRGERDGNEESTRARVVAGETEDCVRLTWDRKARVLNGEDLSDPASEEASEPAATAVKRLRAGLLLFQSESETPDDATPYDLTLVLATRDALAWVPPIPGETLLELAQRHPSVRVGKNADDEQEVVILDGPRPEIERLLVEAAALALRHALPGPDEPDADVSAMLRVKNPGPARPPTARELRALAALESLAADLAREAPEGIVPEP